MQKQNIISSIKLIKENSVKRNFCQSLDLILNLKGLDLKKTEQQIDIFINLHHSKGKAVKICGLLGPELASQAKEAFESVIIADDFPNYAKDKKALKKLADGHDFFVAQANIMAQVASTFGKVLGPRGKMPNPKVGCVVPPNANLKPLSDKLHKVVRLTAKTSSILQLAVGKENMIEEELADNIVTVYNSLIHALPNENNNIKNVLLKLTMGRSYQIDEKGNIIQKEALKKEEKTKIEEKKEQPKAEEKKENKIKKAKPELKKKKKEDDKQ